MHVQTTTDQSIQNSDELSTQVEAAVAGALGRLADQFTRVEVHLSDENAARGAADDKRCMMEARLEGRRPTAVTHRAATVEQAVDGAVAKLARSLERTLARLRES